MRLNKFIAQATGLSRRAVDRAIVEQKVRINGSIAVIGQKINESDKITLNGKPVQSQKTITIMLNKPAGYVCSRKGQGSETIYDLLPSKYHELKPVGRLDKDSSGLILLTNDGELANKLTHPSYQKTKVYEVQIDQKITPEDLKKLGKGVMLEDGPSKFYDLARISDVEFRISLREGRNRQIRRTFEALGYRVTKLHRTHFGSYNLGNLRDSSSRISSIPW